METIKIPFTGFPKMARLNREIVITEKIDGTNACIKITEDGQFLVGSRTRWITPEDDNHGFAKWAYNNKEELMKLGVGQHFGEWWGSGINRGYGLAKGEKRFSLFNTARWYDPKLRPICCEVVPILYQGMFSEEAIKIALSELKQYGSWAQRDFKEPEGIVIFHTAANNSFKVTIKNDEVPKSLTQEL